MFRCRAIDLVDFSAMSQVLFEKQLRPLACPLQRLGRQSEDRLPDPRCQLVPGRDELSQRCVRAAIVQPVAPTRDTNGMLRSNLRNLGHWCNSRLLHQSIKAQPLVIRRKWLFLLNLLLCLSGVRDRPKGSHRPVDSSRAPMPQPDTPTRSVSEALSQSSARTCARPR